MSKQTNNPKPARNAKGASLDWNAEGARMETAAKEKAGSRGNALDKCRQFIATDTPAAKLLRDAAGDAGAQAFIEQPRNVLAKLPRLAVHVAQGTPWCSMSALGPEGRRKEDASVVVALAGLGAGNTRQKENVAQALGRYPGGANAQMPAALEALAFVGIVERVPGSKRNADYKLIDAARAEKLMPRATEAPTA